MIKKLAIVGLTTALLTTALLAKGKTVTTLDRVWIAESAQFKEDGEEYFYAYIDLKTFFLYRYAGWPKEK